MQTACNTYWDAGEGNLTTQNTRKPFSGRGSAPDPAGELTAFPRPSSWWGSGIDWLPLPKNPTPAVGPAGLASPIPHSKVRSDAAASSRTYFTLKSALSRPIFQHFTRIFQDQGVFQDIRGPEIFYLNSRTFLRPYERWWLHRATCTWNGDERIVWHAPFHFRRKLKPPCSCMILGKTFLSYICRTANLPQSSPPGDEQEMLLHPSAHMQAQILTTEADGQWLNHYTAI